MINLTDTFTIEEFLNLGMGAGLSIYILHHYFDKDLLPLGNALYFEYYESVMGIKYEDKRGYPLTMEHHKEFDQIVFDAYIALACGVDLGLEDL